MGSTYRLQLEQWLKSVEVLADRVLDVGGSQLPVQGRVREWNVSEYVIADLETPHKTEKKPDMVLDLNKPLVEKVKPFDVVFCLEVFEYIYDPVTAVKNLALLTEKSGTLYATFPFVYPHHEPFGQDSLRYTEWGANRLLDLAGFRTVETWHRQALRGDIWSFYLEEGMRPSKNYDHHETCGFIVKAVKI